MTPSTGLSRLGRKLAKDFRLHGEALALFQQGWAVAGAGWDHSAWLIAPDGTRERLPFAGTPKTEYAVNIARLILGIHRPVVSVIMTGQVCGKYPTQVAKASRILMEADQWHASAFKGWADQPGKYRDDRLIVESELRSIALGAAQTLAAA